MTRTAIRTDDGEGEMVSVDEASRRLYISRSTVRHYIDNGRLQARGNGKVSMDELLRIRAKRA